MGYEVPASRPGRPSVVGAAVACLFLLAAIQVISAIVSVFSFGPMIDAARDYAGGTTEGDAVITTLQISRYGGFAFAALFAVGYAVLGLFVNRGKNPARIVSWVVLGIGLCCNGIGLVSTAASGMFTGGGADTGSSIDPDELQRRMDAAIPGWANAVTYILLAISIIAALAAIILLALPAANEYFRKVEPAWEPPVPGGTYPAPGGTYPAPGQPGQPGDPNQPGGGFPPPGP
jgi:hypothetical protein